MNPDLALHADTLNLNDPESMEEQIKKLEKEQLAIAQAEAVAKQKEKEADEAKRKLKEMKNK